MKGSVKPKLADQALLITAANDNEASIIESLMNGYGIPVIRKYREAGGYLRIYMGMSVMGIDLYVPADRLNEAKELLKAMPQPDFENDAGDGYEKERYDQEQAAANRRLTIYRRLLAWAMLIAIPGFIWAVIALIINFIRNLIK